MMGLAAVILGAAWQDWHFPLAAAALLPCSQDLLEAPSTQW